jgi:hypothetical protein
MMIVFMMMMMIIIIISIIYTHIQYIYICVCDYMWISGFKQLFAIVAFILKDQNSN